MEKNIFAYNKKINNLFTNEVSEFHLQTTEGFIFAAHNFLNEKIHQVSAQVIERNTGFSAKLFDL